MQVKLTRQEVEDLLTDHLKDAFPGFRVSDDGISLSSYDCSVTIELEKAKAKPDSMDFSDIYPANNSPEETPPSSPPPSVDYRLPKDDIPF